MMYVCAACDMCVVGDADVCVLLVMHVLRMLPGICDVCDVYAG